MHTLFGKIQEAGKNTNTTLTDVILKVIEEAGEVAAEDLRVRGIKPLKENQNPTEERKEESVDLLLSTLDLCFRQMSEEEIKDILDKKLNKWISYKK